MRVLTALPVDEIKDHEDGRVDLLGLREDWFFDQVPVLLERLTVFVELEIAPADRGRKHTLVFQVAEEGGKVLKAVPVSFGIPPDYPRPIAPLDPTLFEIPFERFGPHALDIFIGNDGPPYDHARRVYLSIQPRENDL